MGGTRTIYIVLTSTGTWLSRAIGWYTGEELNHASIAFDSRLEEVYSFGRKMPKNPFIGGFVREQLNGEWFLERPQPTPCAIYCLDVSTASYNRIRHYIRSIEAGHEEYTYNLIGLLGVAANVRIERSRALFCSQFVATALEEGGVKLTKKPPCLTTPQDLSNSERVRKVYHGSLIDYFGRIDSPRRAQLCYNRMEHIS